MYSIGAIISTYRKKKKMSQPQLAKTEHEVSYKAISKWETNSNEPNVTMFMQLCKILGITNVYEDYFGTNNTFKIFGKVVG